MSENSTPESGTIILYTADDGTSQVRVLLKDESVWLPQRLMADLYQVSVKTVNEHIANIYNEGELDPQATIRKFRIVQQEGERTVSRNIDHYNLDAILAVGYRVRSTRGVQFRQWATGRLREYLVKGFALDDERLKGTSGVTDYFDELLARIRDIRASEARVYQRIRDIFALAVDYRPDDTQTQTFFAAMQNKMHYAATGFTAAEIIQRRSDAEKPNMGLTSWAGSRVRKSDTEIAKNYLSEQEIDTLNRITVMFLDQAEFRAQRRQNIRMDEWEATLDKFLDDTDLPVLADSGTVSREQALEWAHEQYDSFSNKRRKTEDELAEKKYIEDLRNAAKLLNKKRKS